MHGAASLARQILTAANDDPLALSLPAFVILAALAIVARVLKDHCSGALATLFRAYLRGNWFLASLAVAGFTLTVYLGRLSAQSRVDLEADIHVSAGQFVEARANDPNLPPYRLPVVPNERRIYRFEGIPTNLTHLRIDPTETPDAHITIYSVSILSGGRRLRWFGPGDLKSWRMINSKIVPGNTEGLNIVSTTGDPILDTDVSLIASPFPIWLRYLLDMFRQPHFFTLGVILWFLIFLLFGVAAVRGAIDAALVAVVAVAAYPIAIAVRSIPMSPPSVSSAIGYASYTGYPKIQDHLISFVLLALCIGIAWLAARSIGVPPMPPRPEEASLQGHRSAWATRITGIAVSLSLGVLYVPSLRASLEYFSHITFHPVDWDSQNGLLWGYLISRGYLPFRDFWYPYSGFFGHALAFPAGALIRAADCFLTLWFLYLAFRFIFPRWRLAGLLLFLLMLVPAMTNEFVGWFRYFLGVDLVLFYLALQAEPAPDRRRQAWFACLAGFVCLHEPTQMLYAGAGILGHTILAVWPKQGTEANWRTIAAQVIPPLRQRIISVAIPALAGILPVLLLLAATGMLPGFIAFHRTLSDQSVYGAISADVTAWTLPVLRFDTVFMLLFFTLVLAFHGWFRDRYQPAIATVALLITGLAGVMAMQKQLVRPHNMHVVQVYPYLAVLLYGVSAWPRRTRAQAAVVAMFLGYVAGMAQYQGVLRGFYLSAVNAPSLLAGDFDVLLGHHPEIREVNASQYALSRFAGFVPENAVMQDLKNEFGWTAPQKLYVLGDESIFYVLAGQEPPYVANNYNCSPLVEQERVQKWLRQQRPRFVVWNPVHSSFDQVPHVVRLPLIYQYVVEHYRPLKTSGPYQILVTVAERAGTDPSYWAKELGTSVDLGRIPQLTDTSAFEKCPPGGLVHCGAVVQIHFPGPVSPAKAVASIDSFAGAFQLQFDLVPGSKDYIIDLDRLWFRSFLTVRPNVGVPIPGAEVVQASRLRKSGVLY